MTGFRSHRDNQRVSVAMWVVDLVDGDHAAAILLSQILWWHQTPEGGQRPRANFYRNEVAWLLRADDDWYEDCRMTDRQVRRIRKVLLAADLIIYKKFKHNGGPTGAWRPNFAHPCFARLVETDAEVVTQTSKQTARSVETDRPIASQPISTELVTNLNSNLKNGVATKRASSFPVKFFITAEMLAWAAEKVPTADVNAETEQFCDYHRAKGDMAKDWTASWRTWMRNAVKFSRGRPATNGHGNVVRLPNRDNVMAPTDFSGRLHV